jgi:Ca2+-binding RTX toxin-like protein
VKRLIVLVALLVPLVATAAYAATISCPNDGTICYGTPEADVIYPAPGGVVYALGGDDEINGPGGPTDEEMHGGNGWDTIYSYGNTGSFDTIYGDAGRDTVQGFDARERIYGGLGADLLKGDWELHQNGPGEGDDGRDIIRGEDGNDGIYAGFAADTLIGGLGNDSLNGHEGIDRLFGGDGDDHLYGGEYVRNGTTFVSDGDADYINCGPGYDVVWEHDEGIDTIEANCEEVR